MREYTEDVSVQMIDGTIVVHVTGAAFGALMGRKTRADTMHSVMPGMTNPERRVRVQYPEEGG